MTHFFKISAILFFVTLAVVSCKNNDDDVVADFKAENRKALGTSGEDLLSADTFTKLRIEFLFTALTRPKLETINAIEQFLEARVNKPGGISIIETEIPAPSNAPFSLDEIRDIEDEYRTQYTIDDDIAVSVFFANGSSENDTETSFTLGSAYQNTSMVVYRNTLFNFVGGNNNVTLAELETVTSEHEFGHLFSLVNLTNDDIHAKYHLDTVNDKHCVIEGCLMFFSSSVTRSQMETRFKNRSQGNLPVFDDLCIEDLQAKGGK